MNIKKHSMRKMTAPSRKNLYFWGVKNNRTTVGLEIVEKKE